ncbi:MAG: serine hydrolase domain-containing protein [Eisenbergiella sp.]
MKALEKLDDLLEGFVRMEHGPAGCALKAVRGQEIIYEGYKGYADEKAGKLIGTGTVYRMYSCTKVVTAAAAMLLLERGKMLLDDPVSRYLPEYGDLTWCRYTGNNMISLEKTGTMTIRHLLTMTSGFTYDGIHNTTQQETKRVLEEMNWGRAPPVNSPAGWHRCRCCLNRGPTGITGWTGCAGAVIEVISGMPFGEFLKRIF